MRDCRFHLIEYKTSALFINYTTTALAVAITVINLLISAFDPTLSYFTNSLDNPDVELVSKYDYLADEKKAPPIGPTGPTGPTGPSGPNITISGRTHFG